MSTLVHRHLAYKQDTISFNQYNIFFTPILTKITITATAKGETSKKNSLRECSSCFFPLSFSCRNCYCCAVNIIIGLMYVFVLYIHIFVQYAYFCSCLHWLSIYFVIYQSDSYIMMEFDPIHDIIAGSTTTFYAGYCATSPSSFVSTTPQFCDKELHPFFFLFTNSMFFLFYGSTDLTFCMQKDQIDIWY